MNIEDKKVIFIDLDSTLIKTISGNTFALCIADMQPIWKVWNYLKYWANKKDEDSTEQKYLFIASNQGGIELGKVKDIHFKAKIRFVVSALEEYINNKDLVLDYIYCDSNDKNNPNRKPNIGMFKSLITVHGLTGQFSKDQMLMIGDACPKTINPDSFSDSDYMFAKNIGIDYLDVTQI